MNAYIALTTLMTETSFKNNVIESAKSYEFLKNHYNNQDMCYIDYSCGKYIYDGYRKHISFLLLVWALIYYCKNRTQILPKRFTRPMQLFKEVVNSKKNYEIDYAYFKEK